MASRSTSLILLTLPLLLFITLPFLTFVGVLREPPSLVALVDALDSKLSFANRPQVSPTRLTFWAMLLLGAHLLAVNTLGGRLNRTCKKLAAVERNCSDMRERSAKYERSIEQLEATCNTVRDTLHQTEHELRLAQAKTAAQAISAHQQFVALDNRWLHVFKALPFSIAILRSDGTVCVSNGDGFPQPGQHLSDTFDVGERWQTHIASALEGGSACWETRGEVTIPIGDALRNDLHITLFRLFRLPMAVQQAPLLLLVSQDVTGVDLDSIRALVKEREDFTARVQQLCKAGNVGLFQIDLRRRVLRNCNSVFARQLGFCSREAIINLRGPVRALITDWAEVRRLWRTARQNKPSKGILTIRVPNGQPAHSWLQITARYEPEIQCLSGAAIDVSDSEKLRRLLSERFDKEQAERSDFSDQLHKHASALSGVITLAKSALKHANQATADGKQRRTAWLEAIVVAAEWLKEDAKNGMTVSAVELKQHGLFEALRAIKPRLEAAYGLQVSLQLIGAEPIGFPRFDERTERIIHRATEELISNAGKHAYGPDCKTRPVHVQYTLKRPASGSSLCDLDILVRDEGRGFPDNGASRTAGTGLIRFRDQLEAQGLSLTLNHDQSRGAAIRITGQATLAISIPQNAEPTL